MGNKENPKGGSIITDIKGGNKTSDLKGGTEKIDPITRALLKTGE